MLPDSVGLFVFSIVSASVFGGAVGVVVTAVSCIAITPTWRSLLVDVLLGAMGFIAGIFVCWTPTGPDHGPCTFAAAALPTAVHEIIRFTIARRKRDEVSAR